MGVLPSLACRAFSSIRARLDAAEAPSPSSSMAWDIAFSTSGGSVVDALLISSRKLSASFS
jgi:hypothetical protein